MGITPDVLQAVEGADTYLVARLYSLVTDSYVGLAGEAYAQGRKDKDFLLSTALVYLERAKDGKSWQNSTLLHHFHSFTCQLHLNPSLPCASSVQRCDPARCLL